MKKIIASSILVLIIGITGYDGQLFSQAGRDINTRGVDLGEKNKYDDAIKEFDKAIDLRDKAAAKVYHNKGYALEKKGELKEAIKNYEEAWKRNPKQVATGERLGFGYYQTEDYENAVKIGEAVLKIDPQNREVPKWLGDAYDKLVKARQQKLLDEKKRMAEEAQKKEDQVEKKKIEEKKKEKEIIYVSLDAMLRIGYYLGKGKEFYGFTYAGGKKGANIITDEGLLVNTPEKFYLKLTPTPAFEIAMTMEKPFLGALTPPIIEQRENLELIFHFKSGMIGFGGVFHHYDSDISWSRRRKLWDFKPGLIVGYRKDEYELKISLYPRILFPDGAYNAGYSLDVGTLMLDYSYYIKSNLRLYAMIHARDYYVFCHSFDPYVYNDFSGFRWENVSNYWGVYDLGIGISITDLLYNVHNRNLAISVEWIERFYLRDLNNDNPYTLIPNGQGWFGLNIKKFTKGHPFSGFRALSQVIGVRFDEYINEYFFLYQKLIMEICDPNEDHHEFNLLFGLGVKY